MKKGPNREPLSLSVLKVGLIPEQLYLSVAGCQVPHWNPKFVFPARAEDLKQWLERGEVIRPIPQNGHGRYVWELATVAERHGLHGFVPHEFTAQTAQMFQSYDSLGRMVQLLMKLDLVVVVGIERVGAVPGQPFYFPSELGAPTD